MRTVTDVVVLLSLVTSINSQEGAQQGTTDANSAFEERIDKIIKNISQYYVGDVFSELEVDIELMRPVVVEGEYADDARAETIREGEQSKIVKDKMQKAMQNLKI
ncbi:hypothetical protein OESDEN_23477, partial [Oesophagostomum dentatum]